VRGISNAMVTLLLLVIVIIAYAIIIPILPKNFPNIELRKQTGEFKLSLVKAYTYNNIGYIILYNYGDKPITIIRIINGQTTITKTIILQPNTITELKINNPQSPIWLITDNGITIQIPLETQ